MPQLRIITWNIGGGFIATDDPLCFDTKDLSYFAATLRALDGDVICLQECQAPIDSTQISQAQQLAQMVPMPHQGETWIRSMAGAPAGSPRTAVSATWSTTSSWPPWCLPRSLTHKNGSASMGYNGFAQTNAQEASHAQYSRSPGNVQPFGCRPGSRA